MPKQTKINKKEKYPLHPIDKFGKYTEEEMERFMVFLLLDRATSYAIVCKAFDALDIKGLSNRDTLKNVTEEQICDILKKAGYRFATTAAPTLKTWSINTIDITKASREEMVNNIHGMGYKLASMFLRNTRGARCAVIDTHVKKWLKEHGVTSSKYDVLENEFMRICNEEGIDPYKFDMKILQERRR